MRNLFHAYLRSPSRTAQFLRFATVGVKISLIDIGGVYLLPWLFGMSLYVARIVSLSTALLVGYLLNRHFTFAHVRRPGSFFRQLAGHFGVHLLGGVLNYGTFSLIVTLGREHMHPGLQATLLPIFALWIGGMVGMTFNFFTVKTFVFQTGKAPSTMVGGTTHPSFAPMQVEREG